MVLGTCLSVGTIYLGLNEVTYRCGTPGTRRRKPIARATAAGGSVRHLVADGAIQHSCQRVPHHVAGENIAAGIYHMKKQYSLFLHATYTNRIKLSLAAYNCGAGRVFDAGDIARFYKYPSDQWKYIKEYLAMLRNQDWKIHLQVWPQGKPKHGYFYGSDETIPYVDNIWEMYEIYREIL